MKDTTTINNLSGTWYIRIPPSFARHIGLTEEDKDVLIPGEIQDEENKKGQHSCSFWKKNRVIE